MPRCFKIALLSLIATASAVQLPAQAGAAAALAKQVKTDVAILSSEPTVTGWQRTHIGGKFEFAHYQTANDPYEVDYARLNRWCAAFVGDAPAQVVRAALFYVPEAAAGSLPSQPRTGSDMIARECRMQAIWYETHADIPLSALIQELSVAWGRPNGQSTEPDIRGWGQWKGAVAWHRQGMNVWTVYDLGGDATGDRRPRLLVYARRDIPRDLDTAFGLLGSAVRDQAIDAAAQIAGQNSTLTAAVLNRARCDTARPPREAELVTIGRLAQWLKASDSLASARRASALLLADAYVACSPVSSQSLMQLGAKFRTMCPQQGPSYSHSFRQQAENLDAKGVSGELAGLASLAEPCSLEGRRDWPDLVIAEAGSLLSRFPRDQWTPWVHYAMARARAAKVSFAYPGGNVERDSGVSPLSPAVMAQEREAAVERFQSFLQEKPDAPESVFAWQESWRLMAALPPSPVRFGCGCE